MNNNKDKVQSPTTTVLGPLRRISEGFASLLNRNVNRIPTLHRSILLTVLGISVGLLCLNLILDPDPSPVDVMLSRDSIISSLDITDTADIKKSGRSLWHIFDLLDSLKQTPFGKSWYDSLMKRNPLVDQKIDTLIHSLKH